MAPAGLHNERNRGYRESAEALRLGYFAIERGRCLRVTRSDRNHVPPLSCRRADAESAPRRRCVSWSDDEKYDARQSCQSYHGGRDVRISLWSEPVSLTGYKTFRDSAHWWRQQKPDLAPNLRRYFSGSGRLPGHGRGSSPGRCYAWRVGRTPRE